MVKRTALTAASQKTSLYNEIVPIVSEIEYAITTTPTPRVCKTASNTATKKVNSKYTPIGNNNPSTVIQRGQ